MTPTPSVFSNRRFPPDLSLHRRFVRTGTKPLIFALTPVMTVIMALALLGQPIDGMLRYGTILAFATASVWTWFQMARTPATVRCVDGMVHILSALEYTSQKRTVSAPWRYVIDLQKSPQWIRATIGHTSYDFHREDWDYFGALGNALAASQKAFIMRQSPDSHT